MHTNNRWATRKRRLLQMERHREEVEWTLNAIVGAIVTGKLPPDDAFAWARIAAREVATLLPVSVRAAAADASR
jgi:hypothetical protein